MAEAITNARLGEDWEAYSAGTHPASTVHPLAVQVLKEIGIDHQSRSKDVSEYRQVPFDLVVTVCDSAAEECPLWLGPGRRVNLGFPDPVKVSGNEEFVLEQFRGVRDQIADQIPKLIENY